MPFAYLRKHRAEQERQRARPGVPRQPRDASSGRAVKIGLMAIVFAPILLQLPWLHSAFGPGSRMPALWVRSDPPSTGSEGSTDCWNVAGGEQFRFCEDMHAIPGTSTVLISCDAHRAGWNTVMGPLADAQPRGGLFSYSYPTSPSPPAAAERGEAKPVALVNFPQNSTFHPLGVSLLPHAQEGKSGGLLFVVNHRRERSSVELFQLSLGEDGWEAIWQRSIVHPVATHTPNSIHALTASSFVVTNDHFFARRPGPLDTHLVPLLEQVFFDSAIAGGQAGWRKWLVVQAATLLSKRAVAARLAQLETVLGLSLGWVSYVQFEPDSKKGEEDGVEVRRIATGIPFANGVAVTPDERTMIVAATTYPGIWMYDLPTSHPLQWHLRPTTKLHLPFRVDNLAWSHPTVHSPWTSTSKFNNLTLLATGHPAPFRLIAMSQSPLSRTSPSWSVAIAPHAPSTVAQVWEDSDAPLPAHHFTLSHNPLWSIRTLLQSTGEAARVGKHGEKVKLPSSASSFFHSYGHATKGTLLVSGLYGPVLACTNVST
ncbi:hypothetical protein EX895_004427 [Sporisorium graminicola]|uniref:Uncharacterized protein n=1 Tax=Sporisorium graminicola TaxID=280036 RepID=A0A4U7KS27_9BASI|nr:hypothetical protein EX895_004427 [Sporisorium graminicola]TKY86787.1 hypothetical protein EX895_004427 [Sporisorium graminicola]